MDYKNGKIYKLQCDDGYYYFGSSATTLTKRLYHHKQDSKNRSSYVYQHINTIGWNRVRIVLVEEYSCENKQQLTRKEDEYIRLHKDDSFCLNSYCAFQTSEERQEYKIQHHINNKEKELEQYKQWVIRNKEKRREYMKEYNKQYHQNKKLSLTTNAYNTDKGADASGITKE